MDTKQLAKEFVLPYFSLRESFFNAAWDYVNSNFEKISSAVSSSDKAALAKVGGPLAFGGSEERGALKAILIFADGFRELPLEGDFSGLVGSIKSACNKYHAEEGLTREILKKVNSLENRIAKFMKPELPIRTVERVEGEKLEYRMWYKDSESRGKPISAEEKEGKIKNAKDYALLIIREETHTQVFINGKKSKRPPGKLAYRILSYVFQHKGNGGTAWNIAQHVWESKYNRPFKDVRETIKSIEMQQRIEKTKIEQSTDDIEHISTLVRRRIADLNKYFLKKLNIKLEAKEMDEYELTTVPKYCLIEKA